MRRSAQAYRCLPADAQASGNAPDLGPRATFPHPSRAFGAYPHLVPTQRPATVQLRSSLFADDFEVIATNIASDRYPGGVEAPMIIRARDEDRWFLFLDQYADWPQGYFAMESTDLDSGEWRYLDADEVSIPPSVCSTAPPLLPVPEMPLPRWSEPSGPAPRAGVTGVVSRAISAAPGTTG